MDEGMNGWGNRVSTGQHCKKGREAGKDLRQIYAELKFKNV